MCREPSRQALGRHLKEMWHAELERQNAIAQSKPHFSNKWQPPVWPDLQFVIRFIQAMKATVTFSPRER
jgi:hypothetical protein